LAEATNLARRHWEPAFIRPLLGRLHGDGLGLWQDAVRGDEVAYSLLLDWIEDSLPQYRGGWYCDRDYMLEEAKKCRLLRPRQMVQNKSQEVRARIEQLEGALQGAAGDVPESLCQGVSYRPDDGNALAAAKAYVAWLRRPANEQACVVQGTCLGFEHGWAELPGGVVFDGLLQWFYPKGPYYQLANAQPRLKHRIDGTA
jgi:hypothetical protein